MHVCVRVCVRVCVCVHVCVRVCVWYLSYMYITIADYTQAVLSVFLSCLTTTLLFVREQFRPRTSSSVCFSVCSATTLLLVHRHTHTHTHWCRPRTSSSASKTQATSVGTCLKVRAHKPQWTFLRVRAHEPQWTFLRVRERKPSGHFSG